MEFPDRELSWILRYGQFLYVDTAFQITFFQQKSALIIGLVRKRNLC